MGPWLASMGPAHGPLAWVLHKGPGRGSCTRTPGEGLSWPGSRLANVAFDAFDGYASRDRAACVPPWSAQDSIAVL